VTATCERFDVVIEPVAALPESPFVYRIPVYDPDGLHPLVPAAVLAREDWLLGVVGVRQAPRWNATARSGRSSWTTR
jgi:hypothetical protein